MQSSFKVDNSFKMIKEIFLDKNDVFLTRFKVQFRSIFSLFLLAYPALEYSKIPEINFPFFLMWFQLTLNFAV